MSASELLAAASVGDLQLLQQLLDGGLSPNARTSGGWTALHAAAIAGQLEAMQLLIQRGAPLEARNLQGCVPLHSAVNAGQTSAMQLLLDAGAEVDAADCLGYQPTFHAAMIGHVGALAVLLDAGADVNALSKKHCRTALHMAAMDNYHGAVELLLERGADANAATAVKVVRVEGNNSTDYFTALHFAAYLGYAEVAEMLLSAGAPVAARSDPLGFTPLHLAAHAGHAAVVQQLLAAGADVNELSNDNYQPLWLAAVEGHLEVVELLVCGGADQEKGLVDAASEAVAEGHMAIWAFLAHKVHVLYPEAVGRCVAGMDAVAATQAMAVGWKGEVDRHEEVLEAARRERGEGEATRQQAQQLIIQSALMLKQAERRLRDMERGGKRNWGRDSWWSWSQNWRGLCLASLAACVAGSTYLCWNSNSRSKGHLQLKSNCLKGS
jgi:ankyrin repeat protein